MNETVIGNIPSHVFRKNRFKRADHDFYPTPPEAIRALLDEVSFQGSVWEPACGDGAIAKELFKAGHQVVATDLIDRGFGVSGVDFLKTDRPLAKNIITNPPYGKGLGDKFIKKAMKHCRKTGGKVAMLLNLSSLCYPLRSKAFANTPPKAIYGLDQLTCWPNGDPSQATRSIVKQRYCWVVWEMGYTGKPEFWWLFPNEFKDV